MVKLLIDGKVIQAEDVAKHHTLRFVSGPATGELVPVLYTDGKREVRQWALHIEHDEPRDPYGRSA